MIRILLKKMWRTITASKLLNKIIAIHAILIILALSIFLINGVTVFAGGVAGNVIMFYLLADIYIASHFIISLMWRYIVNGCCHQPECCPHVFFPLLIIWLIDFSVFIAVFIEALS